jgi:hypothetical protein
MGAEYTVSIYCVALSRTRENHANSSSSYICLGQLTECIPTFALLLMFGLHVVVRKQQLTAEVGFLQTLY